MRTIGERVVGARVAAGLTRHELACQVGRNARELAALEDDAAWHVDPELLYHVAHALGVAFRWLVAGDPNRAGGPNVPRRAGRGVAPRCDS